MLPLKLLFCLSVYIIFTRAGLLEEKLRFDGLLHVDRADGICRGKSVPYQSFFQGIKTANASTKALVENSTFIVQEGGIKKLLLTIVVDRCYSKENLDSCEQYFTQSNIDYCKDIDPDNFFATKSPFYIPYKPPIKCPINKGVYHAYNFTVDLGPLLFFKLDSWYWKARSEVVSAEDNKLVYCMHMEGYATYSKSKKN